MTVSRALSDHPDRMRWNSRFAAEAPDFVPHPLVADAVAAGLPAGPVLELACGRSGSALALAAEGRDVVAVDISDVALGQLAAEAERRSLAGRITLVHADVPSYRADGGPFALVLATFYWDATAFRSACAAVVAGGLLGWEALAVRAADDSCPWRVRHGELGGRLPGDWVALAEHQPDQRSTRLLARRKPRGPSE